MTVDQVSEHVDALVAKCQAAFDTATCDEHDMARMAKMLAKSQRAAVLAVKHMKASKLEYDDEAFRCAERSRKAMDRLQKLVVEMAVLGPQQSLPLPAVAS